MSINDDEFEVLFSSDDYKRLHTKSKDLEVLTQHLGVQNKEMASRVCILEEQNSGLKNQNQQLANHVGKVSKEYQQMKNDLHKILIMNEKNQKQLKNVTRQLNNRINEAISSRQQFQHKISEIMCSNTIIKQELQRKQEELAQIRNIDKLNKHVQAEVQNASAEISTELTAETMDQRDIQFGLLKTEQQSLCMQIKNAKQKMNEQVKMIERLQNCTHSVKNDLDKSERINEMLNAEAEKNKSQIDKLEQKIKEMVRKERDVQEQRLLDESKLEKMLADFEAIQVSKMKQDEIILGQSQKMDKLNSQLNQTKEELRIASAKGHQLQNNVNNLNKQMLDMEERKDKLNLMIDDMKEGSHDHRIIVTQLETKIDSLEAQMKCKQDRKEEMLLKLQDERNALQKFHETRETEIIQDFERSIQCLKQQVESLKNILKNKAEVQQTLRINEVELTEKLQACIQERAILTQKMQALHQQNDTLSAKLLQKEEESRIRNKDKQSDQLKNMKRLIEEYFTNLAMQLMEVGNLDTQDISGILKQQEEIVKQYITDTMTQIGGNA